MNTNEMLIGGYTLAELKKIQTAVRKDANKIISDAIETATKAMDDILNIEVVNVDDLDEDDAGSAGAIGFLVAMLFFLSC